MEDEHQSTLKKKIQILFQLGKWPDVVKLCDSYLEKYGKDSELDVIRYKSERHMGGAASPPKAPEGAPPASPQKEEPPLLLSDSVAPLEIDAPSETGPLSLDVESPASRVNAGAFEPEFDSKDMFGSDDNDENELIITDPFELDEPGLSMAPEQPPVSLSEESAADAVEIPNIAALEMDGPADAPPASPGEEGEIDFKDLGSLTLDADPELSATTAPEKPTVPLAVAVEAKAPEEPFQSGAGGVDVVEEPEPERPAAFSKPEETEESPRPRSPYQAINVERAMPRKRSFNAKLALLIILPIVAAVSLWLALTGRLNFSGTEKPTAAPEPVVQTPAPRRPRPKIKAEPAATVPQVDAQDQAFNEKFAQAEALYKKGDLLKAWGVLLEAKKIKSTDSLRLLEESLAKQIRAAEEKAKQQTQVEESQWQLETRAFERATAENTLSGWQAFMKAFPNGEYSYRAQRNVALLEKKAKELADQQLLQKIQQAQKIRPRAAYLGLSQADITAMLGRSGRPPTQFEPFEHGGMNILLDYASGLMWTLWKKPMAYDKAKWWANRVTAGYGGWRLPTAEEVLALLQVDRSQYSELADFAVWTGDTVSDQSRSAWMLKIPEGRFSAANYSESGYVWAVRRAGK
jgi:hypothetical protein